MPIALVQKERTEKGPQFPEPTRRRPYDLKSIKPDTALKILNQARVEPASTAGLRSNRSARSQKVDKIGHPHASNHESARYSWDEMSILVVPD